MSEDILMIENCHGLRTNRSGGLGESEHFVEPYGTFKVMDSNADVGKSHNWNGRTLV